MTETKQEMIERLKTNKEALMFLLEDPKTKKFLEENWGGNMLYLLSPKRWETASFDSVDASIPTSCYRLREDFELPVDDEYMTLKITVNGNNQYVIDGLCGNGKVRGADCGTLLSVVANMPTFCGVKFEGQSGKQWSFDLRQFISSDGHLYPSGSADCTPAIPSLARFKRIKI